MKIDRITVAQFVLNAKARDQRLQPTHGHKAGSPGTRGAFKAIGFRQCCQRTIDFPKQHRRAGGRAAAVGNLAIDDDDSPATNEAVIPAPTINASQRTFSRSLPGADCRLLQTKASFRHACRSQLVAPRGPQPHRGYVGHPKRTRCGSRLALWNEPGG